MISLVWHKFTRPNWYKYLVTTRRLPAVFTDSISFLASILKKENAL